MLISNSRDMGHENMTFFCCVSSAPLSSLSHNAAAISVGGKGGEG